MATCKEMFGPRLLKIMVVGIVLGALLPATSTAQVYKCKDASGNVSYQSTRCTVEQEESKPVILESATLSAEEKFKRAAHSAGMTPEEARRRLWEAENPALAAASRQRAEQEAWARDEQLSEDRATRDVEDDCKRRFDALAEQVRNRPRKSTRQAREAREAQLEQIESDRKVCMGRARAVAQGTLPAYEGASER